MMKKNSILNTHAVFTPELVKTIEELQWENNVTLNDFIQFLDYISEKLFEKGMEEPDNGKKELFQLLYTSHSLRKYLNNLAAPIEKN